MTTAQKVLQTAADEIGYRETGNNNNKFGVWYGMNNQPWCAMFVSYCFYTVGLPLKITTNKGFAYCPYGVKWFKDKGLWHKNPEVGDVVFYDWGGDQISDHVGIVEKINDDGSIIAIEGNTSVGNDSNGGQVMQRERNKGIIGYGRPPYTSAPLSDEEFTTPHPLWPGRYIALTSPYMSGDDVLLWQQQMIYRGWTLGSGGKTGKGDDSVFSERDHEVLIQFQKEKGLEVDGKIGPQSWNAAWKSPITPD
jgi:peptidoglycan hydrolase-like protein with peptidoglycan-binding domain